MIALCNRQSTCWSIVVVDLLALLAVVTLGGTALAVEPPNIVLIMTDDQGIGDLGVNISKIAKRMDRTEVAEPYMELLRKMSAQALEVLNEVLKEIEIGYELVGDLPWTEIDFPEDHAKAENEILPRIHESA